MLFIALCGSISRCHRFRPFLRIMFSRCCLGSRSLSGWEVKLLAGMPRYADNASLSARIHDSISLTATRKRKPVGRRDGLLPVPSIQSRMRLGAHSFVSRSTITKENKPFRDISSNAGILFLIFPKPRSFFGNPSTNSNEVGEISFAYFTIRLATSAEGESSTKPYRGIVDTFRYLRCKMMSAVTIHPPVTGRF